MQYRACASKMSMLSLQHTPYSINISCLLTCQQLVMYSFADCLEALFLRSSSRLLRFVHKDRWLTYQLCICGGQAKPWQCQMPVETGF